MESLPTHPLRVIVTKTGKGIWICGATTPFKDIIKTEIGASWNPSKKCWVTTISKLDNIMKRFDYPAELVEHEDESVPEPTPSKKLDTGAHPLRVIVTKTGKGVWICGETTPVKDIIKTEIGASWNPSKKCWVTTISKLDNIMKRFNYPAELLEHEDESVSKPTPSKKTDIGDTESETESEPSGAPRSHPLKVIIAKGGKGILLCGETTPVKDIIKSKLGGRWISTKKCWILSNSKLDDMVSEFNYPLELIDYEV
jgi:hypothetical protein